MTNRNNNHPALTLLLTLGLLLHTTSEVAAQQPAQRILPRVSAPSEQPAGSAPCLPRFDEDLGLYVQACRSFGKSPPADWTDRMVVSVTRAAEAILYSDLDLLEQEQYARFAKTTRGRLPDFSEDDQRTVQTALQSYRTRFEEVRKEADQAEKIRQRRNPDIDRDTGSAESASRRTQLLLQLARLKEESLEPLPALAPVWDSRSSKVPLTAPWSTRFSAESGDHIEVLISGLRAEEGYLPPDVVLWLIRITEGIEPERGVVVAVFDDPIDVFAPALSYHAEEAGTYRLLAAPYRAGRAGRMDITVFIERVKQPGGEDVFFGGVPFATGAISTDDLIFAGAIGDGTNHDTVLFLLPSPTPEAIGQPVIAANNTIGTLPLIRVEQAPPSSWLLIGGFSDSEFPEGRLFVSRLRGGQADPDQDLLSNEIERVLSTCTTMDDEECLTPEPRPANWHAADTDNDGFSDFSEVFGIRTCYPEPGIPPLFAVQSCFKEKSGRCRFFCPENSGMTAQIPLSAMDSPSPTTYDIYIEFDYWQERGDAREARRIPDSQAALIREAFESGYTHSKEPDGAPGFSALDYPIRFHLYQDDDLQFPAFHDAAQLPALPPRSLFFDMFFTPDRKYTRAFHYIIGTPGGGGQSDVTGRTAVVGMRGGAGQSMTFVHETGHLLGLLHNHDFSNPDHTPFHLSVMSYGYAHSLPPPITWDGTFISCSANQPCPDHFRCLRVAGYGRLCTPDCGVQDGSSPEPANFVRFSSGELALPEDACEAGEIPETGFPQWFLPYYYCYNPARRGVSFRNRVERFVDPVCSNGRCVECSDGICSIDFDRDGDTSGLSRFDLDGDGVYNENPLQDRSDHQRMIARGARGLGIMKKSSIMTFYTHFSDNRVDNFVPYPAIVHEQHGGYISDLTNRCDEAGKWSHCRNKPRGIAAVFRGPASGDRAITVRMPAEYCLDTNAGLSVSLRVKPFRVPSGKQGAVLFSSSTLRLRMVKDNSGVTWLAEVPHDGKSWRSIRLDDPDGLGRWTRLSIAVDSRKGRAILTARRGTTRLTTTDNDLRTSGTICSYSFGASEDSNSVFMGFLDDPMVMTGFFKPL